MTVEYIEDVYDGRDRGSYRFSEAQRFAGRLIVDIEILTYVGVQYGNFKYPNPRHFYGYAQLFYGTRLFDEFRLGYGTQRLIDARNDGALNYAIARDATLAIVNSFGTIVGADKTIPQLVSIPALPHTVLKVQLETPGAFRLRVNHWRIPLLDDEAEQIPQDESDPSDGQDEYQEPSRTEPDNPYDGAPPISSGNPDSDAKDFAIAPLGEIVEYRLVVNENIWLSSDCDSLQWITRTITVTAAFGSPRAVRLGPSRASDFCSGNGYWGYFVDFENGSSALLFSDAIRTSVGLSSWFPVYGVD